MADFGTRLREARERKGISLRQIAAATKISVGALEGLERNDISKLPGGIFSRAFVRSYAIEVGLDPDETVRYFLQQFGGDPGPSVQAPAASASTPAPPRARARTPAKYTPPPATDVTDEVDFESKQRMAGVVLKLMLVSVPIAASILYFTSRESQRAAQETGAPAEAASGAAQGAREEAPTPPASAPAVPSAVTAAATATAQRDIAIEVAPSADCWTRLTIDGEVAVSRLIAAGERESRQFRESAVLQVGDAAACAFSIDGRPAKPLGQPGQVRELRITRENYRTFLR